MYKVDNVIITPFVATALHTIILLSDEWRPTSSTRKVQRESRCIKCRDDDTPNNNHHRPHHSYPSAIQKIVRQSNNNSVKDMSVYKKCFFPSLSYLSPFPLTSLSCTCTRLVHISILRAPHEILGKLVSVS